MATLSRPKYGDFTIYRSRNARWRLMRTIEVPVRPAPSPKDREYCHPSPDHEHVYAEYLVAMSFHDQDGSKGVEFILSCVYCRRRAWNTDHSFDQIVKWRTFPAHRERA